jgi:hypothetical protein
MQLRTEIEIDAPAAVVWEILMDGSKYHEWNPFITTLEGELVEGRHINVVVSPPDGSDFRFRPRLLRCEAPHELRWRGKVLGDFLFSGEHYFILEPRPAGRVRLVHGEDFKGFLVRFLGKQLTATARGFVFMNQALKRRAEAVVMQADPSIPRDGVG